MTFRLYQLAGGSCMSCSSGGKVFISAQEKPRLKPPVADTLVNIKKPLPRVIVNPNIEDLQMKLNTLASIRTTKNGKSSKKFISL